MSICTINDGTYLLSKSNDQVRATNKKPLVVGSLRSDTGAIITHLTRAAQVQHSKQGVKFIFTCYGLESTDHKWLFVDNPTDITVRHSGRILTSKKLSDSPVISNNVLELERYTLTYTFSPNLTADGGPTLWLQDKEKWLVTLPNNHRKFIMDMIETGIYSVAFEQSTETFKRK